MTYFPSLTKMVPISREDFAYDIIKEAILGGDLLPNEKIAHAYLSTAVVDETDSNISSKE